MYDSYDLGIDIVAMLVASFDRPFQPFPTHFCDYADCGVETDDTCRKDIDTSYRIANRRDYQYEAEMWSLAIRNANAIRRRLYHGSPQPRSYSFEGMNEPPEGYIRESGSDSTYLVRRVINRIAAIAYLERNWGHLPYSFFHWLYTAKKGEMYFLRKGVYLPELWVM